MGIVGNGLRGRQGESVGRVSSLVTASVLVVLNLQASCDLYIMFSQLGITSLLTYLLHTA